MDEIGVEVDNEIIVKRIVDEGGRSKSFINDTLVSLNTLKELTEDVIEIHSQFSEQGLLDNTTHIDTLDNFGTNKETLSKLKTLWEDLNSKEKLYKIELDEFKSLNDMIHIVFCFLSTLEPPAILWLVTLYNFTSDIIF